MESFFVSPMAFTLEYLMLWTDKSKIVTYGIASALGNRGSAAYGSRRGRSGKASAMPRTRRTTRSAAS